MKVLNIQAIRIDGGTQSREQISQDCVNEYADLVKEGVEFPPVRVYFDGTDYYLADGFHRYMAHLQAGKVSISADVHNGTLRDAILHSLGANSMHGLRPTRADKRKAVNTMLDDFEWVEMSDREIARICNVSHTFVADTRRPKPVVKPEPSGNVATPKQESPVVVQDEEDEVDETQEAVQQLLSENERLNDRLAVEAMDASEEEKLLAKETIDDLRAEIRILRIENESLKISRDTYQSENASMKKQIASLQRQLKQPA